MKQQFAAEYEQLEQWHWWFRGRQRILEAVLQRHLRGRDARALVSLGCGPAEGLAWLKPLVGARGRVLGVDLEPLHAKPLPGIDYVLGNLEQLPLASASFDVVLALDVLEHLDDDAAGLREAARLVKPDGLLLITVPALPSLWGGQDVVSHHRRRYTKKTLLDVFARAGLAVPAATYFNTFLFPPVAGVRWTRRALGLAERPRSDFDDMRPGLVNNVLTSIFAAEQHLVSRLSLPIGVSLLATLSPSAR
jgi:SAM-dependent methyltransferase